ncbi:hypothetical protein IL992_20050 [Microbispora sp. NEAU-D428]|nr:hypothetical protein [Microbispora sitophila]
MPRPRLVCCDRHKNAGGSRGGNPAAWLLVIARNVLVDHVRRHRRELDLPHPDELGVPPLHIESPAVRESGRSACRTSPTISNGPETAGSGKAAVMAVSGITRCGPPSGRSSMASGNAWADCPRRIRDAP